MTESDPSEDAQIAVRVNWLEPEDPSPVYANHVAVSFDGSVFILRFGRLLPPIIRNDEDRRAVAALGSVDIHPVLQIVMPADKFLAAVDSLADMAERLRQAGLAPPRTGQAD